MNKMFKAGDENRTRDNSLEGCSFTTKLHPLENGVNGIEPLTSACKADALPLMNLPNGCLTQPTVRNCVSLLSAD